MAEFISEMFQLTTPCCCAESNIGNRTFFSSSQVGCFQNKLQEAYWNWKKCSPSLLSSFWCLFCAFNDRALCLSSCAIHLYILYPREESHTEVALRMHNALWDTNKYHFVRGLSGRICKARDCCIFSTDSVHRSIILVSFCAPFSPMLSNLQNKGLWSLVNQVEI